MKEFHDVVSVRPLEPVSLHPLDLDEINRLWIFDKNHNRDGAGRGRGRGKKENEDGNEFKESGNRGSIWDDGATSTGDFASLGLADMAAMALKFQSETLNLSKMTESLPKEESNLEIDGGDDEVPEWATDDAMPILSVKADNRDSNAAEASEKRNMLLAV